MKDRAKKFGVWAGAPLIFRFEPFILAAEARTAADAQHLIRCARDAGYRESGVTGDESSRVIAGIRCSIRLEVSRNNTSLKSMQCYTNLSSLHATQHDLSTVLC
jgi:tRNA(Phe) wybutosine-synthesizing methylase Tyw3